MRIRTLLVASAGALMFALPALAHHSFAMFDATKTITLEGTVKKLDWTNPHMWLYVMVQQASGEAVEYPLEMQAIQGAVKFGWKPDIVKPGDKISVNIHPLRDGNHGGQLLSAVLADGKRLGVLGQ